MQDLAFSWLEASEPCWKLLENGCSIKRGKGAIRSDRRGQKGWVKDAMGSTW